MGWQKLSRNLWKEERRMWIEETGALRAILSKLIRTALSVILFSRHTSLALIVEKCQG